MYDKSLLHSLELSHLWGSTIWVWARDASSSVIHTRKNTSRLKTPWVACRHQQAAVAEHPSCPPGGLWPALAVEPGRHPGQAEQQPLLQEAVQPLFRGLQPGLAPLQPASAARALQQVRGQVAGAGGVAPGGACLGDAVRQHRAGGGALPQPPTHACPLSCRPSPKPSNPCVPLASCNAASQFEGQRRPSSWLSLVPSGIICLN